MAARAARLAASHRVHAEPVCADGRRLNTDLAGIAGLALVGVEWTLLGKLSGIAWPGASQAFARIALRLLVGAVLVACAQLLMALVGTGFVVVPLVLAVAAILAVLIRLVLRPAPSQPVRLAAAELGGWLGLGVILAAALVRAFVVPESGWDAYSHWGLRAQAYTLAGSIANAGSEHEYYPPLVPLLEAWLYLHRGAVLIDLGKSVPGLIGGAFAICLGWHLRLLLRPAWLGPVAAAAIVTTTTALLDGFWTGQADLALTAWLTLGALAAWRWQQSGEREWLPHVVVFSVAATLTKLEGTPRVMVVALALLVVASTRGTQPVHAPHEASRRRHWPRALAWLAPHEATPGRRSAWVAPLALVVPALVAALLWTVAAQRAGISANAEHFGAFQLSAIGSLFAALARTFAGIRTGGALLVLVLAGLVAYRRLPRALVLITLGQLALTLVAFLFGETSAEIEVRTSATRLFEQWLPLGLVAAAVALREEGQPIIGAWR